MSECDVDFEQYCSACVQYAKPWPHSDIKSCCRQSTYVFTSRYDSTLLGRAFLTLKLYHYFCKDEYFIVTQIKHKECILK